MKLKNLRLSDLITIALCVCGMLSDINWINVPFWIYLLLIVVYGGLRLSNTENSEIKDI